MKNLKLFIFIILLTYTFTKSGKGGTSTSGKRRVTGSLRNSNKVRFTSSRKYGRSKLWFSNHYVNIHYTGHHNYYDESEYFEDYDTDIGNLYLIYAINGTFLINHIQDSNYKTEGHYITFSENKAVPIFLENITEFQSIFGEDTKIIIPISFTDINYDNNQII